MNKAPFFASLRRALFGGSLSLQQVYRIETLLDAILAARWPLAHAAYALATAHHETARWLHLKELGGADYFRRMYDRDGSRPVKARELGNTEAGDGARFAGRGYVQLTGRANYAKASKAIGIDLLSAPERAEEPTVAARILVWGMATGAYTGKRNADYLDKVPPDYGGARRIINGSDKAALIAGYARDFEAALRAGGYGVLVPVGWGDATAITQGGVTLVKHPPPPAIVPAPAPSLWARILSALGLQP